MKPSLRPIGPHEVHAHAQAGDAIVLDLREPREFGRGHVPGAVSIPMVNLAKWGPKVLLPDALPLVLIAEPDDDEDEDEGGDDLHNEDTEPGTSTTTRESTPVEVTQAMAYLTEAGMATRVVGYLAGGFEAYAAAELPVQHLPHVGARALADSLGAEARLIDVRRPDEFDAGHIPGAANVPLDEPAALLEALHRETERPLVLICRVGNRSATAASLLLRHARANGAPSPRLHNLIGGYTAWSNLQRL